MPDPFGHRAWAQDMGLGVGADQQGQFQHRHLLQQPFTPERRAFRTWRRIATALCPAGIAQANRQDRDGARVVELVLRQPRPLPQSIA